MPISERKKREIQLREDRILDEAQRVLLEEGFAAMSMERLAERVEFSRGTIYGHFGSRYDILSALIARSTKHHIESLSRGCEYPGTAREKVLVMFLAAGRVLQEPGSIVCLLDQLIYDMGMVMKAREERLLEFDDARDRLYDIISSPVALAIERGELNGDPSSCVDSIGFLIWAIMRAAGTVMCDRSGAWEARVRDIKGVALDGLHALMDGLGWKPLSGEWDYGASIGQIERWLDEPGVDPRLDGVESGLLGRK